MQNFFEHSCISDHITLFMNMFRIPINQAARFCLFTVVVCPGFLPEGYGQAATPKLLYTVSMPEPSSQTFHVELDCRECGRDSLVLRMPRWMPGYYQIMDYPGQVGNFTATAADGSKMAVYRTDSNTWKITTGIHTSLAISYDVYAAKRFVAESYLDSTHGYIIPEATFMYASLGLQIPVTLKIVPFRGWHYIATGLDVTGNENEFMAPDFDILYDSPILVGNLEEFPSFAVMGVKHRFIAFDPDSFDRHSLMEDLRKAVQAAADLMGDVPCREYVFIGIGRGMGGIEHLNSTTVSFTGRGLDKPDDRIRILKYLIHEYFHHFNVKRIRPYELGPFDYSRENRTNLLWVSEGLTVYYEYLLVRRAGLMSDEELLASIAADINAFENDPGRSYQSLTQASYNTWRDGPFGNRSGGPDQSISYYEKGALAGLVLDLAIRHATGNGKSLDDVMRYLYHYYYKTLNRGFTDAEFQQACEDVAGISLSREFEYVNTTVEIDYSKYLDYAGLKITEEKDLINGRKTFSIIKLDQPDQLQQAIFRSWTGEGWNNPR